MIPYIPAQVQRRSADNRSAGKKTVTTQHCDFISEPTSNHDLFSNTVVTSSHCVQPAQPKAQQHNA
ncbi:MAG: hypothetical protein IPI29_08585 [Ignavibacteria bacterium]|nr:hypothetical protein [Ignavibacteria bacterium]